MYKFFQNLGRSLMLPVAILPAAAIIAGIGNTLNALHAAPKIAMFFTTVGTTILEAIRYFICNWCSYRNGKEK
ncbi:PTS system transporter subunit IIBC [Staphylococcus aureus]|uniref:PTS system transporter subunit IIBC n=1 Tax=Staphylococcus aureus TaxID=1280 RepID=A0A380DU81_STAAU|nr:PTS system transporter subunit IIBC [Staphylococcus aureus]